jgi:hypothetical protein
MVLVVAVVIAYLQVLAVPALERADRPVLAVTLQPKDLAAVAVVYAPMAALAQGV